MWSLDGDVEYNEHLYLIYVHKLTYWLHLPDANDSERIHLLKIINDLVDRGWIKKIWVKEYRPPYGTFDEIAHKLTFKGVWVLYILENTML